MTDGGYEDFYTVMADYFQPNDTLKMKVNYDPATKDESEFRDDLHISHKSNWADCLRMPDYFYKKGSHLCYAIHELYDHNGWAFQDIAKINNIEITVKVEYEGESWIF